MSRPGFGVATRRLRCEMVWCLDMTFGVATTTLQWKTDSVATGFAYLLSRHSLGVATGPGLWAVSRHSLVCLFDENLSGWIRG